MDASVAAMSWGNRIAKGISIVFHPLFIPSYSMFLLLNTDRVIYALYDDDLKQQLVMVIFIGTVLLPIASILVLRWKKTISSFHLHDRKERAAPLGATLAFFFMTHSSLAASGVDATITLMTINSVYIALAIVAITLFWKISIHATAMGGVTASFLLISHNLSLNPILLASSLVVLSGAVCFARIKTDAHQPAQVYVGYLMGIAISLLTFLVL